LIARLAAAALVLAAGCGSSSAEPASRVERCTERFLSRTEPETAEIRRYVEKAYCAPFDQRGWVHDDGALRLAAYTQSGAEECQQAQPGGAGQTVPCAEIEGSALEVLDCALLHLVRRSEVREYVEGLQRTRDVRCDDGTPLDDLGAR